MCMICDSTRVLAQNRLNPDWPGLTFPGGHVEPADSFVRPVIREVKEETEPNIADIRLCRLKQFTHRNGEYRYIVLFYRTSTFSGELRSSAEGSVFRIERNELEQRELADVFLQMLPIFEDESKSENYLGSTANGVRKKL